MGLTPSPQYLVLKSELVNKQESFMVQLQLLFDEVERQLQVAKCTACNLRNHPRSLVETGVQTEPVVPVLPISSFPGVDEECSEGTSESPLELGTASFAKPVDRLSATSPSGALRGSTQTRSAFQPRSSSCPQFRSCIASPRLQRPLKSPREARLDQLDTLRRREWDTKVHFIGSADIYENGSMVSIVLVLTASTLYRLDSNSEVVNEFGVECIEVVEHYVDTDLLLLKAMDEKDMLFHLHSDTKSSSTLRFLDVITETLLHITIRHVETSRRLLNATLIKYLGREQERRKENEAEIKKAVVNEAANVEFPVESLSPAQEASPSYPVKDGRAPPEEKAGAEEASKAEGKEEGVENKDNKDVTPEEARETGKREEGDKGAEGEVRGDWEEGKGEDGAPPGGGEEEDPASPGPPSSESGSPPPASPRSDEIDPGAESRGEFSGDESPPPASPQGPGDSESELPPPEDDQPDPETPVDSPAPSPPDSPEPSPSPTPLPPDSSSPAPSPSPEPPPEAEVLLPSPKLDSEASPPRDSEASPRSDSPQRASPGFYPIGEAVVPEGMYGEAMGGRDPPEPAASNSVNSVPKSPGASEKQKGKASSRSKPTKSFFGSVRGVFRNRKGPEGK